MAFVVEVLKLVLLLAIVVAASKVTISGTTGAIMVTLGFTVIGSCVIICVDTCCDVLFVLLAVLFVELVFVVDAVVFTTVVSTVIV